MLIGKNNESLLKNEGSRATFYNSYKNFPKIITTKRIVIKAPGQDLNALSLLSLVESYCHPDLPLVLN